MIEAVSRPPNRSRVAQHQASDFHVRCASRSWSIPSAKWRSPSEMTRRRDGSGPARLSNRGVAIDAVAAADTTSAAAWASLYSAPAGSSQGTERQRRPKGRQERPRVIGERGPVHLGVELSMETASATVITRSATAFSSPLKVRVGVRQHIAHGVAGDDPDRRLGRSRGCQLESEPRRRLWYRRTARAERATDSASSPAFSRRSARTTRGADDRTSSRWDKAERRQRGFPCCRNLACSNGRESTCGHRASTVRRSSTAALSGPIPSSATAARRRRASRHTVKTPRRSSADERVERAACARSHGSYRASSHVRTCSGARFTRTRITRLRTTTHAQAGVNLRGRRPLRRPRRSIASGRTSVTPVAGSPAVTNAHATRTRAPDLVSSLAAANKLLHSGLTAATIRTSIMPRCWLSAMRRIGAPLDRTAQR